MPTARTLAIAAAVLTAAVVPAAASEEAPDQVNDPPTRSYAGCNRGDSLYQGFTPSRRLLGAVALRLRAGAALPSSGLTFTLRIRRDWPGGETVGSAAVPVPPLAAGTRTLLRAQFDPPLILEPPGTYVLEGPPLADEVLAWVGSDRDVYAGGTAFSCGGYLAQGLDFNFITYTPADSADPETTITAGAPALLTRTHDAQITFSGSDDLSYATKLGFSCSTDNRPPTTCTSPAHLTGLADGRHSFSVVARDEAGHSDPTAAQSTWVVDTTPPNPPTVAGPRRTKPRRPTYVFSAADRIDPPGALRYRCSLDTPRLSACTRVIRPLLTIGDHLLRVTAVDRAGNTGAATTIHLRRIR